ncbi:hypothetical protein [Pseudohoeflea coraliihabitans]|uniref:Uncharacterized protein n=1 Tax=Pseudohoeflea coraliihabitans TaxID=2860393 RepID=A0ABS6WJ22_9HYPH|nr:hypothetical protein [Pseudohoeflea sp. DP4N28-3]MBW3095658.1 hypothetical protein [Pseudohoeflea sp. DP4N28-3]
MSMTAYAKAAWPLLWMECDDQGVFEWKPVVLKARLLPADNIDFAEILEEFVSLGVVMRFEVAGKSYGAVRNFCKFQRPKKPNAVHPVTPESRTFTASSEPSSEPVRNQFGTSGEKPKQMEDGGCNNSSSLRSEEMRADAPKAKPTRARQIPAGFKPDLEWAVSRGLSPQAAQTEAEKFVNYWLGEGKPKKDWSAAWRTWVLKALDYQGRGRSPPNRITMTDEACRKFIQRGEDHEQQDPEDDLRNVFSLPAIR